MRLDELLLASGRAVRAASPIIFRRGLLWGLLVGVLLAGLAYRAGKIVGLGEGQVISALVPPLAKDADELARKMFEGG